MQSTGREPSMEDILASIKKVIAEEKELRASGAVALPADEEAAADQASLDEATTMWRAWGRVLGLSLWQREFIMAARVAGKNKALISAEHILPNILNTLVVQATIQFAIGILSEAALSYVGLGVQPPTPSWGKMLADSQTLVSLAPHLVLFPGLAIVFTVLGLNLMGDGLRDIFDPRLQRSRR